MVQYGCCVRYVASDACILLTSINSVVAYDRVHRTRMAVCVCRVCRMHAYAMGRASVRPCVHQSIHISILEYLATRTYVRRVGIMRNA
jgi:hypothetical protein